jgi:hypothetical protein
MIPQPMLNTGYVPINEPATAFAPVPQTTPVLPSMYVAPISGLPILMQGKQPSCVGHAVAWAIMQREMKRDGSFKLLSPRFLYALSKQSDGINDQGTSISNVIRIAEEIGCCEDRYFPNDVSLPYEQYIDISKIPAEAYANAATHKIKKETTHFLSDLSYNGLKTAIYQNDVVIVGMDISDAWWTALDGTVTWEAAKISPIRPPHPATSRHCIDLYAYNDNAVEGKLNALMNWWSKDWASMGTAFFYGDERPFIYQAAVINV